MPTPPGKPEREWGNIDRRGFLKVAGATTAFAMLDESIANAAAIPANRRHGSIEDVEHVVVLMQENRGFDHYLGTLRGVRGYGDPHPVTLPSGKPVWHQSDGARDILPFRPDVDELGFAFLEGLPHSWTDGQQAVNKGHYDRWVPNKGTTTMAYLERRDAAFHYALADAFTVCDNYRCSFIGNTDPNRYYLWTGWTGNDGAGGGPVLYNDEAGYDWATYPERLERAGVSWKVYQDEGNGLDGAHSWGWTENAYIGNYGDNALLYFNAYRDAQPGQPLYEKARRGTKAAAGDDYFRILREDVAADRLPSVSYIAAPEAFSEHGNWPTAYGAWYIAQVLDALTSNPKVWSKTALFITYDENDGFFDHLVPPMANSPVIPGASTVSTAHEHYDGSGKEHLAGPFGSAPRVPMFVLSPWSTGGYVCSEAFDHTSVIRFMERRFGVKEPQITPWRRAVFGDLTSAFDFSLRPASAPTLMDVDGWKPKDSARHPSYQPMPPLVGAVPKQEPGTRPARPIGYALDVVERGCSNATLSLRFVNHGALGANFHVRLLAPAATPHSYTVGARRHLDAQLPIGASYRVEVHGPDGFFRSYASTAGAAGASGAPGGVRPRIELGRQGRSRRLRLEIVDVPKGADVEVTCAYDGTLRVTGRGSKRQVTFDCGRRGGWYDVTVRVAGIVRTFAGHLENGAASISDPQLGRN